MTTTGLIACPDCGFKNVEGADACERCGQSLSSLSEPAPSNPLEQQIVEDRIEVLRPKTATTVAPGTPMGDVLQIMVNQGIGCVLVVGPRQHVNDGQEGEGVVGIFTERDALLRLNVEAVELADRPVSDFMTPDPETLKSTDKIAFALHKMDLGGYRHVPILADNRPPAIISIRDILRYMTERLAAV